MCNIIYIINMWVTVKLSWIFYPRSAVLFAYLYYEEIQLWINIPTVLMPQKLRISSCLRAICPGADLRPFSRIHNSKMPRLWTHTFSDINVGILQGRCIQHLQNWINLNGKQVFLYLGYTDSAGFTELLHYFLKIFNAFPYVSLFKGEGPVIVIKVTSKSRIDFKSIHKENQSPWNKGHKTFMPNDHLILLQLLCLDIQFFYKFFLLQMCHVICLLKITSGFGCCRNKIQCSLWRMTLLHLHVAHAIIVFLLFPNFLNLQYQIL